MTTEQAVKPPTQGVGVEGIAPKPIELTPQAQVRVDWALVGALPPFQMFIASLSPCPADRDGQRWAIEYATRTAAQRGDEAFLAEYCEWHTAKGYWPKESPFGELLPEGEA